MPRVDERTLAAWRNEHGCPKCGMGTLTDGPHYTRRDFDGSVRAAESLAYDCTICGFRGRIEPVKEAE